MRNILLTNIINGAYDILDEVDEIAGETGATRAEVLKALEISILQLIFKEFPQR